MKYESSIRKHFHGFADWQWDELKDMFPYCEIPHIIDSVINDLKNSPSDEGVTLVPNEGKEKVCSDLWHHKLRAIGMHSCKDCGQIF